MKRDSNTQSNAMTLNNRNYLYMIISIVICAIGYALMCGGEPNSFDEFNAEQLYSFRRITLSVILVLFGHAFMVYAIMSQPKPIKK